MGLSLPHILLLSVVAALLLGGGRFSALMGDVAKGVKNFKTGMLEEDLVPKPPSSIEYSTPIEDASNADRSRH